MVIAWRNGDDAVDAAAVMSVLVEGPVESEGTIAPVEESAEPEGTIEPVLLSGFAGDEHGAVLQACCESPEQVTPPPEGAGAVQVRAWIPPPQDALQACHSDQSPLVGGR